MYKFSYDGVGRLLDASPDGVSQAGNIFAERGITYDKNGNIKTLQRYNSVGTLVDNLTYTYTGNRLPLHAMLLQH